MPQFDRRALLQRLGPRVRETMLQFYARDSCIAATRISIDVLRSFGISQAYALTVRARVFNAAYAAKVHELGRFAESRDELEDWHTECGAHSIGIGEGEKQPGKWAGHLVTIVERKWLWDLSMDQAERPEYGMLFPIPVMVPISDVPGGPEPFLRGRANLVGDYNGMLIIYHAFPHDKSFRESPNWTGEQIAHKRVLAALGVRSGGLVAQQARERRDAEHSSQR